MKFSKSTLYSIASILASITSVSADCDYIDGNYYCNSVTAVKYQNLGFSGSYQDVTAMDESSCSCSSEAFSFSGEMAPLDEELSVHFRGPIKLAQFGVYYPSGSTFAKRDEGADSEECTTTKHVHHQHKRAAAIEYEYVTQTVFQDANGNVISTGDVVSTATGKTVDLVQNTSATSTAQAQLAGTTTTSSSSASSSSSTATAGSTQATSTSSGSTSGAWTRSSYYTPGSADNCVFMNNLGGSGSGTWSSCFGNSISFAGSDGVSAASSSQILADVTFKSNEEFMIFSGTDCSTNTGSDCGYYRDGIPAYHGFAGEDKIFVFEFQMPTATDSATYNYDMPAIWLLNAKIPRTLQYGSASCSCWSTGCGEFDIFEILSSGSGKLISHLHDGQGGGTQDYFARPYDSTMKAAVIFKDSTISIVVLDDSTTFPASLSSDTVASWTSVDASYASLG